MAEEIIDAQAPAAPAAQPTPPSDAETKIEAWFRQEVHNTALAANTDYYNRLRHAVDNLIARFKEQQP